LVKRSVQPSQSQPAGVIRQQGGEARFVTATGGAVTQAMAS